MFSYLAVNFPKPPPASFWHFSRKRGSTTASEEWPPTVNFYPACQSLDGGTLYWNRQLIWATKFCFRKMPSMQPTFPQWRWKLSTYILCIKTNIRSLGIPKRYHMSAWHGVTRCDTVAEWLRCWLLGSVHILYNADDVWVYVLLYCVIYGGGGFDFCYITLLKFLTYVIF